MPKNQISLYHIDMRGSTDPDCWLVSCTFDVTETLPAVMQIADRLETELRTKFNATQINCYIKICSGKRWRVVRSYGCIKAN